MHIGFNHKNAPWPRKPHHKIIIDGPQILRYFRRTKFNQRTRWVQMTSWSSLCTYLKIMSRRRCKLTSLTKEPTPNECKSQHNLLYPLHWWNPEQTRKLHPKSPNITWAEDNKYSLHKHQLLPLIQPISREPGYIRKCIFEWDHIMEYDGHNFIVSEHMLNQKLGKDFPVHKLLQEEPLEGWIAEQHWY